MTSTALRLRCQTRAGIKVLEGLMPNSTIADLVVEVSRATAIPAGRLKIKLGFPPRSIDMSDIDRSLSDLQVQSGDKITADEDMSLTNSSSSTPDQSLSGSRGMSADSLLVQQLTSRRGVLQRKVVPADNSCLFTAINALMTDGTVNLSDAGELRQVIAGVVCSDPETYSEAFLGRPNQEYVEWIMNPDTWGGGIEVAILSDYFQTEIAVVDCQSARINRFGEDKNYTHRIFLLYDGVHYDPLVLEAADGSGKILETRFPSDDEDVMQQASDIAKEAQSSGQFTNVAEFSLRCLICRTPLKGQGEAQQHALSTGHDKYGEFRPQNP
ncbi:hypothetical protein BaRGS_00005303 [Batillaria attramentaria]|uniref:Ubiquitin thioesterase OTU n=1 Tax=Batillaria attramentaria TaxID=370345 RepID=A0ABD0LWN0_9CAEN